MKYDSSSEQWLLSFLHREVGFENYQGVLERGLQRLKGTFADFINWAREVKVITIAGTNGKGETALYCGDLLQKMRISYALWQSPHVLSITERVIINGAALSYQQWKEGIVKQKKQLDHTPLSYYEFLFYFFLSEAQKAKVDVLVLEVGLGGRLDAVNLLDADVSAITSIGRDHQEFLGQTYREILAEKIAITRTHHFLFTFWQLDYLKELTKKWQDKISFYWENLDEDAASYQQRNWLLARAIVGKLYPQVDQLEFAPRIQRGRAEQMHFAGHRWVFVGAHNLQGLQQLFCGHMINKISCDSMLISFSRRSSKDVLHMLKLIRNYLKRKKSFHCSLVGFDHWKSFPLDELKLLYSEVSDQQWSFFESYKDYLSSKRGSSSESILVCGSYYFIGQMQSYFYESVGDDFKGTV